MTAVVRPLIALGVEDGQTPGFAVWTSLFFITYILMVNVVLLNVAVAVLLEGFLSSMADSEMEVKATVGIQEYAKIAGSMDALISTFSSFDSTDQLREMINRLFKYLDVDDSNSVSFLEFRDGLETLDMWPKLHVTEEDWKHFTRHGKFLDENETLNDIRFDLCMQEELKAYSQRIISHQMRQAMNYCKENSLDYLAHKMQMAEVFKISNRLSDLSLDWKEHSLSPSTDVSVRETLAKNSGEWEWKEVRDLLQQLAAGQKELRLGQQELRLGVKRLEAYVCEYGLARGRNHGENGVKTEVGSGVERGAWSPAVPAPASSPNNVPHTTDKAVSTVSLTASLNDLLSASREITAKYRQPDAPGLAHEEIPALTSAPRQRKSMEDLTRMSSRNVNVDSTRKDLIRDPLTRRTGKSPGSGVIAPLPLPLRSSVLPLPLPCPSPSLSQENLDRELARLRETQWHERPVGQNGAQTLVRHNSSGSPGPKPRSESLKNSTFDGTDSDGLPLP